MSTEEANERLEGEEGLYLGNDSSSTIYPNAEVRVEKAQFSILHLKTLCETRKELIIDPDFQRNSVWKDKQAAELIESILMGIPIPLMYLFETKEGKKQVVDGRQRITAILNFLNNKIKLNGLKLLPQFNGKRFADLELKMQGVFEDYQLLFFIIQPPTPERVKYDIFDRVNRGGTQLNNQEMRHALYQGPVTKVLKELSESDAFLKATGHGVKSDRMRDQYVILRAIAFMLAYATLHEKEQWGIKQILYKGDMDEFLAEVMMLLNKDESSALLESYSIAFLKAMERSYKFMGEDVFRFEGTKNRRPINMPLFEVLTFLFASNLPQFNDVTESTSEQFQSDINDLKVYFDQSGYFVNSTDSLNNVSSRFIETKDFIDARL